MNHVPNPCLPSTLALLTALAAPTLLTAQEGSAPAAAAFSATQQKGFDFLLQQQEDGRFFMVVPGRGGGEPRKMFDAGLTGLCLAALQTKPADKRTEREQATIDAGLKWLLTQQSKAGSFGRRTIVYATSSVVFALTRSDNPEFKKAAERALRFLQVLQKTEKNGNEPSESNYGSFGYGEGERGDLSNTTFAIQAMRDAGLKPDDEGLAKAVVFLQRLQNLRAVNTLEHTSKDAETGKTLKTISGNDGGATYYPGDSAAGFDELADGSRVPRSYGSMTYALLKTYTLCGLEKDDKRVQAALRWAERNWTVDYNPGSHPRMGEKARYQGLYYYYMVMAQALALAGADTLTVPGVGDAQPTKVDWRKQLAAKLATLQSESGSWQNDKNDRWFEGMDTICTAYAMLALEHCR